MKAIEKIFATIDRSLRNARTRESQTYPSFPSPSQAHGLRHQPDQNTAPLSLDQFAAMCLRYIQEYNNRPFCFHNFRRLI